MQVTGGRGSAVARLGVAGALLRAGQVLEAHRQLDELGADVDGLDDAHRATLLAARVDARLARGQLAEAAHLRPDLEALAGLQGAAGAIALFGMAELTAVLADSEEAIELYLAAGARAEGQQVSAEVAPWRAGAVLCMVRTGRRDTQALAADHYEEAVRSQSPYAVAVALRTLATADANGRRLSLLREARAVLADVVACRLGAQIDTDIAGLLMLNPDASEDGETLELLRGAERYAASQELWPLHGRICRLLDRLGHTPRHAQSEAAASLTEAELRVVGLAADGLTNRQIADHLVVSVKAVEWHLSRVYRKLGIRSRAGLAPRLGTAI